MYNVLKYGETKPNRRIQITVKTKPVAFSPHTAWGLKRTHLGDFKGKLYPLEAELKGAQPLDTYFLEICMASGCPEMTFWHLDEV